MTSIASSVRQAVESVPRPTSNDAGQFTVMGFMDAKPGHFLCWTFETYAGAAKRTFHERLYVAAQMRGFEPVTSAMWAKDQPYPGSYAAKHIAAALRALRRMTRR